MRFPERRAGSARRAAPAPFVAAVALLAVSSLAGVVNANAANTGSVTGPTGVTGSTGTTGATPATVPFASACSPGPVPATTTTTSTTTTSTTSTTTSSTTTTTTQPSSGSTTTLPSATTTSTVPTTTTLPGPVTTTTVPITPPQVKSSYYLLTSAGDVDVFGGALSYGSKSGAHMRDVVSGAATVDGGGYWFTTSKGGIYNFGDAQYFGSAVHDKLRRPIVAMAATPDSEGYWLVGANGAIFNFGDAPFCGSAIHQHLTRPVTGIVATADGGGYWLITASGIVIPFGDAGSYGEHRLASKKATIVAMARTADGLGYWTAESNGAIFSFGDAAFYGSAVHRKLSAPVTSIASSATGHGYWLTLANGRVFNYGDAPFDGSLAHRAPKKPITVIAIIPTIAVISAKAAAIPHGLFGYDMSNGSCTKAGASTIKGGMPTSSPLSIIEVAGWLDGANNSCLAALTTWAKSVQGKDGTPYELYLFMNSPGTGPGATAEYGNGPRGICSTESGASQQVCVAYNYGYNGAKDAYAYATAQGAIAGIWWLDVEGTTLSSTTFSNGGAAYWGNTPSLNAQTIQGALDALHQEGLTVGIYSTSVQYPKITGGLVPVGQQLPIWVAGVPYTNPPYSGNYSKPSILPPWCAGTATYPKPSPSNDLFAGGVPWILQETPGSTSSPYGLDPDYSC